MKRISLIVVSLLAGIGVFAADFNAGWTFWYEGHGKETVNLPHDAMIHGPRRADAPGGNSVGFYDGALYIYEKSFDVPDDWLDKHVTFRFGGVYKEAKVYLNGQLAGGYPYGYMPFTVVADGFLHKGTNIIRVEADNVGQRSSRWYSGGGIYRGVELTVQDSLHIESTRIQTISVSPEARIRVEVAHTGGSVRCEVLDRDGSVVAAAEGQTQELVVSDAKLWTAETPYLYRLRTTVSDEAGVIRDTRTERFGIRILSWSDKGFFVNGTEVLLKGGCIHADNGILGAAEYQEAADRRVRIMKEYGYNAIRSAHNPASYELLQACDSLGMYLMDELWDMWFQPKNPNDYAKYFRDNYRNDLDALVEKDYNHPSVVFYSIGNEISEPTAPGGLEIMADIVDRLHRLDDSRAVTGGMNTIILGSGAGSGMMMGPPSGDSEQTQAPQSLKKKKARKSRKPSRTYEEPEIPEGGLVGFGDIFRRSNISSDEYNQLVQQHILTDDYMIMGRELDSIITPSLNLLDIVGYNYATVRYPSEASRHPGRLIFGSETYPQDIWKNWQMVEEYPYVAGDFMWTAWDYIGECGIGSWSYGESRRGYPAKLADCGALDLIGNPTGEAYWAKAVWAKDSREVYMAVRPVEEETPRQSQWRGTNSIPSWTWTGKEGVHATVEVFTPARRVRLYLNGKRVGSARTEQGVATFELPYEPGELKARACGVFRRYGEVVLRTAQGENQIELRPESSQARPGEVVFVQVNMVAANGEVDTCCEGEIQLSVEGGTLLGFGSSAPVTEARFDSGHYQLHYGRGLAAVRADAPGEIRILASSTGLADQQVTIPVR